jgi:hypothetical protein
MNIHKASEPITEAAKVACGATIKWEKTYVDGVAVSWEFVNCLGCREHMPPDPTVFAVVYSSYADDEVHGLYKTRELAEAEASRLGGMWEVSEWTVNSTPDEGGETAGEAGKL